MEPPATHARRASSPKPKSGDDASPTPPPADTCATCMSSPSRAAPSQAALDSVSSGGWPASSLTAGASARSAVITASTSFATSSATSGSRSSPTTSSTRPRSTAINPCRADRTLAGIIPSDGRWPMNLAFENVAAQAASPYPGAATSRATAPTSDAAAGGADSR
eukprot:1650551-Pleurochrysis_carterae.AAC.2